MAQNPFTFGNPVNNQTLFVGRQVEIRQIVSRLLSSAHESTSLVGDSRMGNTSLLKYLSNPVTAAEFGLHPDSYLLVYMDFQRFPDLTPHIFWKRVITSIYRSALHPDVKALAGEFRKMNEFDLFDLEDFFLEINEFGFVVVLFMDEFEYVTQSPNISDDFFGGLRSLAIHNSLPLIPASRHELVDLCHSEELKGSPFFNIFANVYLRPFSPEESDQMLDIYLSKSGLLFTEEDKRYLAQLGNGHPYFLQMAGYYWFYGKDQMLEGQELFNYVFENYYQQSIPHLRDLWSACLPSEQNLMQTVASAEEQDITDPSDLADLIDLRTLHITLPNLVNRGLLKESSGRYGINLPCLKKFLIEELPAESKTGSQHITPVDKAVQDYIQTEDFEVFISHSSSDKSVADLVVSGLERRGIQCWIAPRNIQPGTPYPKAIINALNICRVLVVIFSKAADESIQVMQEVERAVSKGLTIIPIRIEDVVPTNSLELMLSSRHWLDAYDSPVDSHFDALADTIRG